MSTDHQNKQEAKKGSIPNIPQRPEPVPETGETIDGTKPQSKGYMSRKLVVFVVNDIILVFCYILTLEVFPELLTTAVIITFMSLIVLNGITYIGGDVLDTWAKSKWFRSELVGK